MHTQSTAASSSPSSPLEVHLCHHCPSRPKHQPFYLGQRTFLGYCTYCCLERTHAFNRCCLERRHALAGGLVAQVVPFEEEREQPNKISQRI